MGIATVIINTDFSLPLDKLTMEWEDHSSSVQLTAIAQSDRSLSLKRSKNGHTCRGDLPIHRDWAKKFKHAIYTIKLHITCPSSYRLVAYTVPIK